MEELVASNPQYDHASTAHVWIIYYEHGLMGNTTTKMSKEDICAATSPGFWAKWATIMIHVRNFQGTVCKDVKYVKSFLH